MKKCLLLVLALCVPGSSGAVANRFDIATYGYGRYERSADDMHATIPNGLENLRAWRDEMQKVATMSPYQENPTNLKDGLEIDSDYWDADFLLIMTHGKRENPIESKLSTWGLTEDDYITVNTLTPDTEELEISILYACEALGWSQYENWMRLGNLHKDGAHATLGCFGKCNVSGTGSGSTLGRLGYHIRKNSTLKYALFKSQGSWDSFEADTAMVAIGKKRPDKASNECANRVQKLTRKNRLNYEQFKYSLDTAYDSRNPYEFCGIYYMNY